MRCLFFKQMTSYEMRISDWSSDVCSSDLLSQICRVLADQERRQVRFDDDLDGFSAFGTPSRPTYAAALADADKPARTDLHDRIALLLRRGNRHLAGTRSGEVHQRHRSEERRVGKECVRTLRTWWSPDY